MRAQADVCELLPSYLGGEESVEVRVEGEDRVVSDSLQKLVQSFHPRLYKVLGKPVHHTLHHELLRQWLQTRRRKNVGKDVGAGKALPCGRRGLQERDGSAGCPPA